MTTNTGQLLPTLDGREELGDEDCDELMIFFYDQGRLMLLLVRGEEY